MFGPAVAKSLCWLDPAIKLIIILFKHWCTELSTAEHRFNDLELVSVLGFTFSNVQQITDQAVVFHIICAPAGGDSVY